MNLLKNYSNINRIRQSFTLLFGHQSSRGLILGSSNFSKLDNSDQLDSLNNNYTINTNKFNLPVVVKPSRFQKLKEKLGFQGALRHPQPVLAYASFRLYLCIQYQVDYDKFFKLLNAPDVMYSFCLVTFFHVWLLSVPLFQHGQTGLFVRRELLRNMWKDIETRERKLKAPMTRKNKLITYTHLNDIFRAFMFGFDEGILSDDTVLAGAIWRHLLEMRQVDDYQVFPILCDYTRKNLVHFEKINELDFLKNGIVSLVDFDQKEVDHLKQRTKIIEKIRAKEMS